MAVRFLHLADVHLGTYHWGSRERARDYGRALRWVADYALQSRSSSGEAVRFVLIAGDLFDRAGIDAATHDEANEALRALRRADIPVIVTEGNHDRPRDREVKSWLESFNDRDLLVYLSAGFTSEPRPDGMFETTCRLAPYDFRRGEGSYVDIDNVRVVGLQYLGHALRRRLAPVAQALDALPSGRVARTILMVHGGVEGIIPGYKAEVSRDDLAILEPRLDYLALGHIHKRFTNRDLDDPRRVRGPEVREWVFNPGSLQVWRRDEAGWKHGFFDVTLHTERPQGLEARFVEPPHRPCVVMTLNVGECATPADLLASARRLMQQEREVLPVREDPLAFLVLTGQLRFDRRDLDLGALDSLLREIFRPIAGDVADQTYLTEGLVEMDGGEGPIDQARLEREVLRQLWLADERDKPYAAALAELTQQAKGMVLDNLPAADVADHLLAELRKLRQGA